MIQKFFHHDVYIPYAYYVHMYENIGDDIWRTTSYK